MNMTSLNWMRTFAVLLPGALVLGGCAGIGIQDAQAVVEPGHQPDDGGITAVFQIAWIYYGLLVASRPVIVWNVVGVVTNSLTVWAYKNFSRREREAALGR